MKKSLAGWIFAVALTVVLAGCASQRGVSLPRDVTFAILSIDGENTLNDARPDITFGKDGRFYGSTGCNRYFGQYACEGQSIEVAPNVGMTQMYCHNAAQQEQAFAKAIVRVKKFEIHGNRLVLSAPDGTKIEGVRAK